MNLAQQDWRRLTAGKRIAALMRLLTSAFARHRVTAADVVQDGPAAFVSRVRALNHLGVDLDDDEIREAFARFARLADGARR